MRKLLLIVLSFCFLLGMAAKAEVENVEKETGPVSTAIEGGKAFGAEETPLIKPEEEVIESDVTGEWTQAEIGYFQNKKYVGDKKLYNIYTTIIDYYPLYTEGKVRKTDFYNYKNIDQALRDLISLGKVEKKEILRYFSLLRNEIYARKGYIFKSPDLKDFFDKMKWYNPEKKEVTLNGKEKYNVAEIEKRENLIANVKLLENLYTKEVIIKARWGSGPGEFGLEPLDESYEWNTHIVLDNESNIYIADEKNLRINTFDKSDKFLRSIPIPEDLIYTYGDTRTSLVEGLGVDKNGNIYLASSSTKAIISSGTQGEVVLKIDKEGKRLEKYSFSGSYVYPVVFYRRNNEMYLWGSWGVNNTAAIPLGYGKIGVSTFSPGVISSRSFQNNRQEIALNNIGIKINNKKAPVSFNVSRTSRVVFFDGRVFYFQDADGELKAEIHHKYFCYYPLGEGFPYKNAGVMVGAEPYIDEELNIYWVEGTPTHLHVIKYTPTEEIWK